MREHLGYRGHKGMNVSKGLVEATSVMLSLLSGSPRHL